jgi:hypothetical protein
MHLRIGLDDVEKGKFLTIPDLELRTSVVQPIASNYISCTIAVPKGRGGISLDLQTLAYLQISFCRQDYPTFGL